MRRYSIHSLSFSVGAAVIMAQVTVMSLLGVYFIHKFSQQIDGRVQTQIKTPGVLMNAGLLSYAAIDDPAKLRTLAGDDVTEAIVVGANQKIFHASNPSLIGKNINSVANFDPAWLTNHSV